MPKKPLGIPLAPKVVIKPHFIINDFSSDDEIDEDDVNENNEDIIDEENFDESGENVDESVENTDVNTKYDGNFFKNENFDYGNVVPMEVLEEQMPCTLSAACDSKDEDDEQPVEETEDEKNRRNFLDWKAKLEVFLNYL